MATQAELEQRLETLQAARATGTLTVRTADGRTVTYKSDSDMATAIGDLKQQIAGVTGATVTRFIRCGFTSGVQ